MATESSFVPSVNEMKSSTVSDKPEKGSLRVDTLKIAVPMNMAKPNKTRVEEPLTPPPDGDGNRSVSFSDEVIKYSSNAPKDDQNFSMSPADSIDIPARVLSQDILTALVERDTEMRDLFARNQEFFDMVKQTNFGDGDDDERWESFLKVLYSKREEQSDSEWMESITEFLSANPPFLVTFKQIIGFYEDDDEKDYDEILQDEDDYYSCDAMDDVYLDITPMRNILGNLKSYPQFFINVKEQLSKEKQRKGSLLGGNHFCNNNSLLHPNEPQCSEESSETLYDEFQRILYASREDLNDVEWETEIYECLDSYPRLIEQFEDIVRYETTEL